MFPRTRFAGMPTYLWVAGPGVQVTVLAREVKGPWLGLNAGFWSSKDWYRLRKASKLDWSRWGSLTPTKDSKTNGQCQLLVEQPMNIDLPNAHAASFRSREVRKMQGYWHRLAFAVCAASPFGHFGLLWGLSPQMNLRCRDLQGLEVPAFTVYTDDKRAKHDILGSE